MAKPDISKLKHVLVYPPLHFYYDVADDGTKVLRHIRVNRYSFDVEGLPISMSDEEFQQLVEGRTEDGKINTIPEIEEYVEKDSRSGVFDGDTLKL